MDPGAISAEALVPEDCPNPGLSRLRVLAWIFVFLLGAELALEARAFQRGWEVLLLRQVRGANRGQEVGFGPTPSFPFRSRIFESDATDVDLRLWVASSSYAEALEYPASEIFPVLLGEDLSKQGQSVGILNSSRMGSTILTNIQDLRKGAPQWRPDMALLYQLSNDIDWIVENKRTPETLGLRAGPAQEEKLPKESGLGTRFSAKLDRLVEESTLYKHLQTQVSSRLAGARPLRRALLPQELAAYRALVTAFVDECLELGVEPVLATFAFAHPDPDDLPEEWARLLLRSNMHLAPEGWCDAVQRGNEILRSVAEERGLALADLDAALSGHSERFRDPWHFDTEGHRIAARVIAEAVLRDHLFN